jgi:putative transposase
MVWEHGLSIVRACRAAKLSRAAYYRQGVNWAKRDAPVVDALNALVEKRQRWGFWKCFDRLRDQGHRWNHKRVHRVYCQLRLNLPRRVKRRLPERVRQPLAVPAVANAVWSLDFMSDWASPAIPDTFDRCEDDIGGVGWNGGDSRRSLSGRRCV